MNNDNPKTDIVSGITGQMKELVAIRDSFKDDQLKFIKGLINPDLTDNELYMFLIYAGKTGLNPLNKEIIAVVYNKDKPYRRVNTIVTRDGKRATAYRKGGIESIETKPIYIKEVTLTDTGTKETVKCDPWEGGKLWGATCTVSREGKKHTATVPLSEYNTGENVWAKKPETMIKKVAESQALSAAVPELLGVYDEAEMPVVETAGQISAPTTETDFMPATEAQKKTVETLAKAQNRSIDFENMTQAQAKEFIAGANKK